MQRLIFLNHMWMCKSEKLEMTRESDKINKSRNSIVRPDSIQIEKITNIEKMAFWGPNQAVPPQKRQFGGWPAKSSSHLVADLAIRLARQVLCLVATSCCIFSLFLSSFTYRVEVHESRYTRLAHFSFVVRTFVHALGNVTNRGSLILCE